VGVVTLTGVEQERVGQASMRHRIAPLTYRQHRFPASIIQHAVWLNLRFTLSYLGHAVAPTAIGGATP
jgi:hypothetical protein